MRKGWDNLMVIRKIRNTDLYALKSKTTGKTLGVFKTKRAALKREKEIEYFKRVKF